MGEVPDLAHNPPGRVPGATPAFFAGCPLERLVPGKVPPEVAERESTMTDESDTTRNDIPQAAETDGEVDNSFAGGVDADDPMLADAADQASQSDTPTQNQQLAADEADAATDTVSTGDDADAAGDGGVDSEHPDTKLAAERLADLQRVQAEYVNYRNRVERDRAREKDATIGGVIESFIPVLDEIELARQHGELSGAMEKIADKIESVLNRYGVEVFGEANEAFDPNFHEALMHVEAEPPEGVDGTFVVQDLQKGFKINERIIRASRVSVAG